MDSKRFYEEVVTDQLSESDWAKVLTLDLNPVYRAYLDVFHENSNRPMSFHEVHDIVKKEELLNLRLDKTVFDRISEALKHKKIPYRLRAVSGFTRQTNKYRMVKVGPAQKRQLPGK